MLGRGRVGAVLQKELKKIWKHRARRRHAPLRPDVPTAFVAKAADENTCTQTYRYWKSISKNWIGNLMAELGEAHGVTTATMDTIDEHDGDAIWNFAEAFFAIGKDELFPRPSLAKSVMRL